MISECPGAKFFKQPEPEYVKCPYCSEEVEIWTDEVKAICSNCKKTVIREVGASCLDWCKYAKECVGVQIYKKHLERKRKQKDKKLDNS
ncbi:MAG: hypothetical protein ISS45_00785 [Candidatus Omnitrophica bacterium]|nr:hypothetical protein [Candidatus Omnitrophota bacterium]